MLGGVWHWCGDCTPIIKSRMADTGEWSPEVPVTEIVPATYIWVITVRRSDHSMNHIPILELPLLRESMPQEEYATVIARAIIVTTTSGMLVPGVAYDGTACADLVDGVLLQWPPSCRKALLKDVLVFREVIPCGYIFKFCIYRGAMFRGKYLIGWTSPSRDLL